MKAPDYIRQTRGYYSHSERPFLKDSDGLLRQQGAVTVSGPALAVVVPPNETLPIHRHSLTSRGRFDGVLRRIRSAVRHVRIAKSYL